MKKLPRLFLIPVVLLLIVAGVVAQNPAPSAQQQAEAEKAFETANTFMEQGKPDQALVHYKKVLAIMPNDPSVLYNGGMAAFASKDHPYAVELWKKLTALDPLDWRARTKLIQVYQAMGKLPERDKERGELFQMWKSKKPDELSQEFQYCRDQFEVSGEKIMVFEHFELKGERALRYVFSIVNETEDGEKFRISLGSYEFTNAVWRASKKPAPKADERLFHLDGYFKNGSHATYGMYFPEPSYDEMRAKVIEILEKKASPVSSTTVAGPETKPAPKPSPTPQK